MDLSWIQHTPEQIRALAEAALVTKREKLAAIKSIPTAERTFANTIGALEYADEELADLQQRYELLTAVHPDKHIRQVTQETAQFIESEQIALAHDRELWRAVQEWAAHHEPLDPVDQYLADRIIRDMRRMGFDLAEEKFQRIKEIGQQLTKIESEFEGTINEYEDHIAVTREQLAGLPDHYIAGLKRDQEGKYLVTLEYPDLFPFMQYAHDDKARYELGRKRYLRGGWENMERLAQMIRLRQEHAQLLGYPTHADFVTETRMAKHSSTVKTFITDLLTKLKPAVHEDLKDLVAIKEKITGKGKKPIHFHEISYWSNMLRKERYDLDSEEVRQYLPTEHVMQAIMDMYQNILGLKFTLLPDVLWHEHTQLYQVADAVSGQVMGYFGLDLYPREGKYGHAAAFPIVLGRQNADGTRTPGLVSLVCNFPRPNDQVPSLLSHDETETLLHEFGHVMHALVFDGRWQRQNGFMVAWDFVEALSQIFEYWAWDPRVLARITKHYKTGQPMPEVMVEKIVNAQHYMDGINYITQAIQAWYDQRMHTQPTDALVDPQVLAKMHRDMIFEYEHIELPEDAMFAAGWGHMAGGYDAAYYGYLWSKVYAADMFTRFAINPLDPVISQDYRAKVLAPGASRPEQSLVDNFLDRPSNTDAFLKELGITK